MTGTADDNEILNAPDATLSASESASPEAGYPAWLKLAGIGGFVVALLIYSMRMNRVFGLFVDDAWYMLLAKALATGQGYAVINSPSPGILPLYPPAYPFLLSLLYRLSPQFPENIVLLKWLSVAAMLGSGALTYWYFTRHRKLTPPVAWMIGLATVLSPTLVFLATSSLMSECVFTCVFLGAVVAGERGVQLREGRSAWMFLAIGAALASGAFLMRSIGLSVMAALFLYLLKERLLKQAIIIGVLMAALAGPWMLYSRARTPTPAQQQEQGGNIVLPYTQQFWQKRAGDATSGTATIKDLPARVLENILEISGRDAARILMTPVFEALVDPGREIQNQQLQAGGQLDRLYFSFLLAILLLIGFISAVRAEFRLADMAVLFSLGITMLWPWETFRFVLPMTSFLIFYLLMSVQAIAKLATRSAPAGRLPEHAVLATAALLLAINLYPQVNYLIKSSGQTVAEDIGWETMFNEAEQMAQQLQRTLPQDGVISTTNPAFLHLYTSHKTVSSGDATVKWDDWKKLGVRYIARIAVFTDASSPEESGYRVVYKSRRVPGFWVVDLGAPTAR